MLEVWFLALALSMDALAVSLGIGARFGLGAGAALRPAFSFGFFQGVMPLLGFLLGAAFLEYIAALDHWVAFVILLGIGAKMIHESRQKGEKIENLSAKTLLILSIATSLDALAAGISLHALEVPILLSAALIALTTFALSYIGVLVGKRASERYQKGAELLGGVILIGIGVKILLTHLLE